MTLTFANMYPIQSFFVHITLAIVDIVIAANAKMKILFIVIYLFITLFDLFDQFLKFINRNLFFLDQR